jgi:hypothetical protein
MPHYKEDFPVGTRTCIAGIDVLDEFLRTWKYHHPLDPIQFAYAGTVAEVKSVSFYHGGDVLYQLQGVPGIWHEQCLGPVRSVDIE